MSETPDSLKSNVGAPQEPSLSASALAAESRQSSEPQGLVQEFINRAPCAFLSFDDSGRILFVNEVLVRLTGYSRDELLTLHLEKLLSVAGRIFYQTHFFPLLKLRESVEEIYLALRTKAGEEIPMLVNARRDRHSDRAHAAVNHCVLLSMRERRKFEDELITARKQVEEAAKMKGEFPAMVSHELRTPLTAILGWMHILKDSADDKEILSESISVIERNAEVQARLIEDLLDFSRITSGKLRLDVKTVDLHAVVRNAIDVVRPAAEAKEIVLTSVLDPNAGPVSGDESRLQQVFWNLLSNAVKFTPKRGRVMVELRRINSHAEILIQDNGVGIEPAFLPFIFERFRQEDSSRTRKHGGLGLGLAIAKEILELHGGTIKARSDGPGQGSIFEIHLPIPSALGTLRESDKTEISRAVKRTESDRPLAGLTIAIVDDNIESLDIVARILSKAGASVRMSSDARSVVSLLEQESESNQKNSGNRPHLLVADLGMPEMDGCELMQCIRSMPEPVRSLPAIALSALVTNADRMRAIECGFQAFIAKPANPKELVLTILNLTRLAATRNA